MAKNQEKNEAEALKISKKDKSSLSEFIERPLPSAQEVASFEKKIRKEMNERKEEENSDELLEIYEDAEGNIVDVKKIEIKRKRGFFRRFFAWVFWLALIGALIYGAYYYFFQNRQAGANFIALSFEAPKEVVCGEEFFYTLKYENTTSLALRDVKIEFNYPENFIFLESLPEPSFNKNTFEVKELSGKASGSIKIKGRMIAPDGTDNLIAARASYFLKDFSTEFKKEVSTIVAINGLGFNLGLSYSSNALIGEEEHLDFTIDNYKNAPNEIYLTLEAPENISWLDFTKTENLKEGEIKIEKISDTYYRLSGFNKDLNAQEFSLRYKIKEKTEDKQKIAIKMEQVGDNNENYVFYEKQLEVEVIKSDLSLSLMLNGNKGDKPVNFGDSLSYTLDYSNKGTSSLKDIVLMAVVDGDFIDWASLKDKPRGERKNNIITWSKNEIPELAELESGKEGRITFSLDILPFKTSDLDKSLEIKSYAQFNIGSAGEVKDESENQSNIIISKLNSDFSFNEELRYFDEDNVPVGDGPLPPQVGQKTSLKVYWSISNNLHELKDIQMEFALPSYVFYDERSKASTGSLFYDEAGHRVLWTISRLPTTVYSSEAEFNISIVPNENDRNKIMILSSGSKAQALDSETNDVINKQAKAQTTKLEDDDISSLTNDGRVQ